ncbi:aldo/keto reductase [Rhizobium sp. SYY.PMSO]|uniref:aldo/keto reductase n=1 Tax=Rhizobium sp. SYY.PMSO TaxID=3382192 RepID=UPI000DE015DC
MTTDTPIRWGIIGPGRIAQTFADGVAHSRSGKLVAIASRNPDKPGLGDNFPGARIVNGYEALLADKEIDAVYIATPHTGHAEWAIKAIRAGKHVLVEKPIALSAFDADAIYHEAKKAGVFAGEAFMYRVHPQTAKLIELVKSGTIGELRIIRSSFGFNMGKVNPEHRLFANETAGGGILDVGGYPVSMARLIAGAVDGKPFLDPDKVSGVGHLGQTGVDEWASAVLKFPNGIVAEVSCSIMANQDNTLRIIGSEGRIEVADFWFASGHKGGVGKIDVIKGGETQTIEVKEDRWLYSFEVDAAGDAIRAGKKEFAYPGIGWADSIGNLRVLDQWRASIGLEYEVEKATRRTKNIAGATVAKGNSIPKRSIPGISKPASLVTLGFEFFPNFAAASLTLDAFYEAGGNAFDTAYVYGGGKTESIFGDWHTSRNVPREEIVLIGKGAHSPLCYPDMIAKQLDQSLNRLKTDYVDIYFMHRDNTDVPVGEFVDAMDAEVKAGRIRGIFGGSNWTRARFDEAIAYAEKNGKTAPAALSNNFSLAEMLDPIWAGCIAASDDEWKAWLNAKQIPNFAWSSQGRGFFTDRAGRDKRDDEELVRVWYSDRNFGRRDRAIELAQKLGRSPIHIALAYVVAQPFPVIPLIGPRTIAELEDSLSALDIKLTPEQVKWLEG